MKASRWSEFHSLLLLLRPHFPTNNPLLSKLPPELWCRTFVNKCLLSIQIGAKRVNTCTCYNWASLLHATVAGWVVDPFHSKIAFLCEKQTVGSLLHFNWMGGASGIPRPPNCKLNRLHASPFLLLSQELFHLYLPELPDLLNEVVASTKCFLLLLPEKEPNQV